MRFYDQAIVKIKAGDGGDGLVSFFRTKAISKGGPDGGDGGNGGSIFFHATDRQNTLTELVRKKEFAAEDGEKGKGQNSHGRNGEDLVLEVPVGTLIFKILSDGSEQFLYDLDEKDEKYKVARGGKGGFGNAHFTSSVRQTPKFAEFGSPGEEFSLRLELRLVADVAIIGLPSSGKSTLISRVTSARPKIADYPFTTLIPNLGVISRGEDHLVIVDVPGLIEGAAEGKGLGHEFLRHIQRTRLIVHLIDATSDDWAKDYQTIRGELERFDKSLGEKTEILAVNKVDMVDSSNIEARMLELKNAIKIEQIYTISALTGEGVDGMFDDVFEVVQKIPAPEIELDDKKIFTFDDVDDNLFEIEKIPSGYEVRCKKLEYLAQRTNFDNWQARDRIHDIIKKLGIAKALKKQGVKDGDIIKIGEKRLEW